MLRLNTGHEILIWPAHVFLKAVDAHRPVVETSFLKPDVMINKTLPKFQFAVTSELKTPSERHA